MKPRSLSLLVLLPLVLPAESVSGDLATYVKSSSPQANLYLSEGDLWFHNSDCDVSGWQYLENIPGARAMDCDGSFIVFVTDAGDLLAGSLNVYSPPHFYNVQQIEIPSEIGSVIDVSLGSPANGDPALKSFLLNDSGQLWSVSFGVASPTRWSGPCDLPFGPVSVRESSWGGVKNKYYK